MPEAPTYNAYLEVDQRGRWLASILDLAGCYADGASEPEALGALKVALPAYFAWLRGHDDYTPEVHGPWQVVPCETFHTRLVGDDAVHAFFMPDAQPVDDEELDWALALLEWAHEDLVALVRSVPPSLLEQRSAIDAWSAADALRHLARTQLWYVSLLDDPPGAPGVEPSGDDPIVRYQQAHGVSMRRLRAASDQQRTAIHEHAGERWSLRKVLRRSVWHVRDHTTQIERIMRG
jgi:predicted RNase H-like HicB family nuclease